MSILYSQIETTDYTVFSSQPKLGSEIQANHITAYFRDVTTDIYIFNILNSYFFIYLSCLISTWSYKNQDSKHFVIFLNFLCVVCCLLCCLLMSVFFGLFCGQGFWVEVDVDKITILPSALPSHLPSLFCFFPAHNSLFNTSDSYLKSVRA